MSAQRQVDKPLRLAAAARARAPRCRQANLRAAYRGVAAARDAKAPLPFRFVARPKR